MNGMLMPWLKEKEQRRCEREKCQEPPMEGEGRFYYFSKPPNRRGDFAGTYKTPDRIDRF